MSENEISSLLRSLKENEKKIQENTRQEIASYKGSEEDTDTAEDQKKNVKKRRS